VPIGKVSTSGSMSMTVDATNKNKKFVFFSQQTDRQTDTTIRQDNNFISYRPNCQQNKKTVLLIHPIREEEKLKQLLQNTTPSSCQSLMNMGFI
jgi:hypothetical protein